MPARHGRLYLGTSGYQYPHWSGRFYPDSLPRRRWFEFYAGHFRSVEINNTFYRLPGENTFEAWRRAAPKGFVYALKFSRYATHLKHLKDPAPALERFWGLARLLGPHLGPILVQLPPRWRADPDRLNRFLAQSPAGGRFAVEFRDPDWLCEEVFAVLRRHRAALCIHDMLPEHPRLLTAGWAYLRFHGRDYAGSYSHQFLTAEANRIAGLLAAGHDVYAYFNNDESAHAVANARSLGRYLARRLRAG